MGNTRNIKTPPQRLPFRKKGKTWRKDNVDAADKHSLYHNEGVRQTFKNRVINLNLYNGIVNVTDMVKVVNPHGTDADYVPDNIPHQPIAVPKIDLLVGEELKRRFDWSVVVTNPDAISAKENEYKSMLMGRLAEFLKANYSDEELETKMNELQSFSKYEWQDSRERMANLILKHYWSELKMQKMFNEGMKDALIMAEEIYQVDIVSNEPVIQRLNPLRVRTVRGGLSDKIEDANIVVLEDHWDPARIVDTFHEELKPKDIDDIMEYTTTTGKGSYTDDDNNHVLLRDGANTEILDDFVAAAEFNSGPFMSDYVDQDGNIRVLRVYWKSFKKVLKVKYYDEEGEVQYKIRSEEYIVDKDLGEEGKPMWVNEMWEGTKIGKDIYIQMKPRDIQFTRLNNPSQCHAGIIGEVYTTNQGKAISLMDRMKNYQYMYDAIWDRLNKSIATNYGKIFKLDISMIPANWEVEKWMHFAITNKIAVVDSFKEGNHGASTGKLAGSMNNGGNQSIDMETGHYIQQHVQLLEFIKMEMGEISGVSQQRQGQVSNRETVGGVERSVTQSSHITEYWFSRHEDVKLRALSAFLEVAKKALKGGNKKAQYILDDQTIQMLNIEGDDFAECDYGVVATNSAKTMEMEQALKGFGQALIQNGGSMSTIMDIYFSPSLSDMRRKLEIAEEEIHQRNSQQSEAQNKLAQEQMAKTDALERDKLALQDLINQRDNDTKLAIANASDQDEDGIEDKTSNLDKEKFEEDKSNNRQDLILKMKALDNDMAKHKDNVKLKEKQINKSTQTKK